jgi:DNA-binding XRE family transcriptional regulator
VVADGMARHLPRMRHHFGDQSPVGAPTPPLRNPPEHTRTGTTPTKGRALVIQHRSKSRQTPLLKNLVALRYARGLKQTEVAERMGVSVNQVSMIENGKRGRTLVVLEAYAEAVGAELTMRALPMVRSA